ncbi:MAG: glycosyltransferase family 2 protein [Candidatus Bathyarchaeia archaeon]|jgi:GT2 family glycosyltransferase
MFESQLILDRNKSYKGENESKQGVEGVLESKSNFAQGSVLCSIIIVTHNNLVYTKQCLESLKKTCYSALEIVVVDAASSDGTVEYLRSLTFVRLVCLDQNYAYSYSLNRGIEASRGVYLCFLNNDTLIVQQDWLQVLVACLNADSSVGVVGPKLVGDVHIEAQKKRGYMLGFKKASLVVRDGLQFPRLIYPDGNRYHVITEGKGKVSCTFLVGACMLVKRSLVSEVGFFDERFFFSFDETDFCMRSWLAGKKVVCNSNAVVVHLGSKTLLTVSKQDFSNSRYSNSEALFYSKYGAKDFVFVLKKVKGFTYYFWVIGYKVDRAFLVVKQALRVIRGQGFTVFLVKAKFELMKGVKKNEEINKK